MNYCKNCGQVISANDKYCGACGQKITNEILRERSVKKCLACNHSIQAGENFCSRCGTAVQETPVLVSTRKAAESNSGQPPVFSATIANKDEKKKIIGVPGKGGFFKKMLWAIAVVGLLFVLYNFWDTDIASNPISNEIPVVALKPIAATIITEPFESHEQTITKQGGTFEAEAVKLSFPKDAMEASGNIVIKKLMGELPQISKNNKELLQDAILIGNAYDFGPDGISFQKPIDIEISYKESDIPKEFTKAHLALVYFDGGKYVPMPALHDPDNHKFSTRVQGFPGLVVGIIATPILVGAIGYALYTDTHKKVYQMVWDPIKRGWMHKMITPDNETVRNFAKRMRVKDGANLINFDDEAVMDNFIKKKLRDKQSIPLGFTEKYDDNKFFDVKGKYISDGHIVTYPEEYLKKVDTKGKAGDCIDITNAYVSMFRAKGYETKGVSGYANDGNGNYNQPHAWVEVVIGTRVYVVDENGNLNTKEEYINSKIAVYPPRGDSFAKMWDENTTEPYRKDWYSPRVDIERPSGDIYAQDGMAYLFDVKTLGIPDNATYQWNFNDEYKTVKSTNKTFDQRFEATGKYKLQATAFWSGKSISKTIYFEVKGKDKIILLADEAEIQPGKSVNFRVNQNRPDYEYTWLINGVKKSTHIGQSAQQFRFDKEGKYNVKVEVKDRNRNEVIGSDSKNILVANTEQEEAPPPAAITKSEMRFIGVTLNGKVEQIDMTSNKKTMINLNHLRIAFNNDGAYEINGTPYEGTISLQENKLWGQFSTNSPGSNEKNEIVLLFDTYASKKLIGFRYKKDLSYNSGNSKEHTTITVNNVPFKMESGKSNQGQNYYLYKFKGNITPYLINCDRESETKTNNGTFGAKWGKFEPEWEISIEIY